MLNIIIVVLFLSSLQNVSHKQFKYNNHTITTCHVYSILRVGH